MRMIRNHAHECALMRMFEESCARMKPISTKNHVPEQFFNLRLRSHKKLFTPCNFDQSKFKIRCNVIVKTNLFCFLSKKLRVKLNLRKPRYS